MEKAFLWWDVLATPIIWWCGCAVIAHIFKRGEPVIQSVQLPSLNQFWLLWQGLCVFFTTTHDQYNLDRPRLFFSELSVECLTWCIWFFFLAVQNVPEYVPDLGEIKFILFSASFILYESKWKLYINIKYYFVTIRTGKNFYVIFSELMIQKRNWWFWIDEPMTILISSYKKVGIWTEPQALI